MQIISTEIPNPTTWQNATILRLWVRNHPGVMSHVCGLFARRAFNVEAILCLPAADTTHSVILLAVKEEARLEQVIRQLAKLEDVLDIQRSSEAAQIFAAADTWLRGVSAS
jgi:acetolactate synthase-1/3 small subunit